jgi:hypothetical protein
MDVAFFIGTNKRSISMSDHAVSLNLGLPADVRATCATLALAGSFAFSGNPSPTQLESDLLHRFAGHSQINHDDVLAWLAENKAETSDLAGLVAQFSQNAVALHTALQQQNDAGGLVLLFVENAVLLSEATTGELLHRGASGPVWLLRSGYCDDPPYGYYYDLGATNSAQPVKILWQTVAGAGIVAAIALDAPAPPLDVNALLSTVQAASDALEAANQSFASGQQQLAAAKAAHENILASLGKG